MIGMDLKSLILNSFEKQDPELHSKIIDFQNFFKLSEITNERYSISFLLDFFFKFNNNQINPWALLNEIKFLEGRELVTKTKAATKFKRPPLRGLWHKHYYDGSMNMLANNLSNAIKKYQLPYFQQMIDEAKTAGEERFVQIADIPHIVNDAVSGNLKRRRDAGKITGEWIVYAIHDGKNYYLGLCKHSDPQEEIRRKIDMTGVLEFPFIEEILI